MTQTVELPLWLFVLIVVFATITFASHFLFPSVRWFFRRRLERAVARLNTRLERPIEPFKLARRFDMIQRLIYDPQVAQAVAQRAAEHAMPENVAFEEARGFAREIVPSFSAFTYFGVATRVARLLSNAIYRVRLGQYDVAALRQIDRDATVVFVMNHRSNMDYVLVTHLVAQRSALSYAVGEWARVWPLSRVIRGMGAFFIRRRTNNPLYHAVLAAYVRLATKGGVTQAIFLEGGLSLDGAMAPPKHGLLKYLVEASAALDKEVVFVPVALNYDWVMEDKVLTSAARAGERRFRARIGVVMVRLMRQLWLWMTLRYRRFGDAAVSFGHPVSLSRLCDSTVPMALPERAHPDFAKTLARNLMQRISALVPVLPVPMVAWLLCERGAMRQPELEQALRDLIAQMPQAHIHLPQESCAAAVESALAQLQRRGLVLVQEEKATPVPEQVDLLMFYANSIAHLVPKAGADERPMI